MDGRLKRLHHKCKYMGVRENDVIFARFAERYLNELSSEELDQFDALLAENDWDIFTWVTGKAEVPSQHDTSVMAKLKECQKFVQV